MTLRNMMNYVLSALSSTLMVTDVQIILRLLGAESQSIYQLGYAAVRLAEDIALLLICGKFIKITRV